MTERTPAEQARAVADYIDAMLRDGYMDPRYARKARDAANAVAEYLERLPAREPDGWVVQDRLGVLWAFYSGGEARPNAEREANRLTPPAEIVPVYIGTPAPAVPAEPNDV